MKRQTILMAALLLLAVGIQAAGYVPRIITGVVKSDSWTSSDMHTGIYALDAVSGGQLTQLSQGNDVYMAPLGGAVYVDGKMQGIHFRVEADPYSDSGSSYTIYQVEYDMNTWTRTKGKALGSLYGNLISSCGITHDPVTGLNYGIFYNFDMNYHVLGRRLATIDFSADIPKKTIIEDIATPFAAIAASSNGFLYGVGQDGFLYIIGKTDGELIPIGDLGISDISTNPSSMTFDPRTGKLYWAYVSTTGRSYLYEINYTIGSVSATRIMQVPGNAYLVNMYIAPTVAGAPAAAESLALNFEGERTTGTVSFTMPANDQDGSPLAGTLTYTITANGQQVATATAEAGAAVSREVTIPQSGDTEICVVVSNDKGSSPFVSAEQYIGRDTPLPATNVRLTYDAATSQAHLTWTAPVTGVHGKTLTPANLTYNVVRRPYIQTYHTGITETAFSETLSNEGDLQAWHYEVTVVNGDMMGEKATSNTIVLGDALTPPFTESFDTQAGFDRFTVVDANDDKATWEWYYKYYQYSGTTVAAASIEAHRNNADDDWLLTPQLKMERGSRYALSFAANKNYASSNYDQKMVVAFGVGDDPATYTEIATVDIDDVNAQRFEYEVIPASDGIYRIGFHAVSNANSDRLMLTNVNIAAPLAGTAPLEATDITVTPGSQGALTATITLTAPTQNVRGDQLTAITKIEVTDADGRVVGSIDNPEPGQQVTINCTGLKNGYNTFTIVPYTGTNAGVKATASAFIGVDRPMAPENITLSDNGTEAILTWTAPTQGYNGMYINPDALTYNLYTIADDGYADLYKTNISQPYHTGVATNEGEQKLLYYALDAESAAGYGPLAASNSLVIGQAYDLPYTESFGQGLYNRFVWFEGDEFSRNFTISNDAADGDGSALAFAPNYSQYNIFSTGKIDIAAAQKPVLTFSYRGTPGNQASLLVWVDRQPQNTYTRVADIDFTQQTAEGWQTVSVDLTPLKATSSYVILRFGFVSTSSSYESVAIDAISISDAQSTGIGTVATPTQSAHSVYDLQGRRLNATQGETTTLPKGIYIVDGKKVVRH